MRGGRGHCTAEFQVPGDPQRAGTLWSQVPVRSPGLPGPGGKLGALKVAQKQKINADGPRDWLAGAQS